ncbi:MAG: polysaccharide biosynthesis protein [Minisyncoccia bacterium]|jgi:FlaA1/EpsC-like NDP-sugar epimerase
MVNQFKNKTILITGGTGTIGGELTLQLLKFKPKQIRVYSRNESRQYYLLEKLGHPQNVRALIGDVRDRERLSFAMKGVNIVFHAAALKHVPFCEYNPNEAVKTNIIGSQNVIDSALNNSVNKVIGISTDKAADPCSVMGVSKLMMEKLFINTNYFTPPEGTKFSCVRFGNVSWSDGSVLQVWKKQAEKSGEINMTNKDMTRFLMSTKQAVGLTLKAAELAKGGEIFILKMPSIRIDDLAGLFISKHFPGKKIRIKEIGNRAGEKIHEDLLGGSDPAKRIVANDEMFILVPSANINNLKQDVFDYKGFKDITGDKKYSSDKHQKPKEISKII